MKNNYSNQFKNYLLAIVAIASSIISVAQTTITYPAGNPQGLNDRKPYGVYYGHERTQLVYEEGPSELNIPTGSIITEVGFYLSDTLNPPAYSYPVKIYMREVPNSTVNPAITFTSLEIPANLVYQGNISPANWLGGPHWVTRTITMVML